MQECQQRYDGDRLKPTEASKHMKRRECEIINDQGELGVVDLLAARAGATLALCDLEGTTRNR